MCSAKKAGGWGRLGVKGLEFWVLKAGMCGGCACKGVLLNPSEPENPTISWVRVTGIMAFSE